MKKNFFHSHFLLCLVPGYSCPCCIQNTEVSRAASGLLCRQKQRRGETMAWLLGHRMGRSAHKRAVVRKQKAMGVVRRCYGCSFIPSAAQSWSPQSCSQLRICKVDIGLYFLIWKQYFADMFIGCLSWQLGACPGKSQAGLNPHSFIYLHVSSVIAVSEPHYNQVLMLYWVRANVNLYVLSVKKGI